MLRTYLQLTKILLPEEVVSKSIDSSESRVCGIDAVQDDEMILDQILSSKVFEKISMAKKIIWNGPIGVFEQELSQKALNNLLKQLHLQMLIVWLEEEKLF